MQTTTTCILHSALNLLHKLVTTICSTVKEINGPYYKLKATPKITVAMNVQCLQEPRSADHCSTLPETQNIITKPATVLPIRSLNLLDMKW